jgi:2-polyprenyl-6-methoxyphenol hydroxylase-like FAD-dependent oxidoreductase
MTPTLGKGANVAMRDAVHLASYLKKLFRSEATLCNALGDYGAEMSKYCFDFVREPAAMGTTPMEQNPLPK